MAKPDPRKFRDPPSVRRRVAHPLEEVTAPLTEQPSVPGTPDAPGVFDVSAQPHTSDLSYAPDASGTSIPPNLPDQSIPPDAPEGIDAPDASYTPGGSRRTRRTRGTGEIVRRATFWLTDADLDRLEELRVRVRVPGVRGVPDKSAVVREAIRRLAGKEG